MNATLTQSLGHVLLSSFVVLHLQESSVSVAPLPVVGCE